MALATTINFTFRDQKGKSSTVPIRVPSGFSFSQLGEFAQAAGQILANASQSQLVEASISVALDLSGLSLKTVAALFSDVAQKALWIAQSTVAGLFARFAMPTLDDGKVLPNSDQLDTLDADVAAMETLLEDGVDDGFGIFIQPVTLRDNAIDFVTERREIFRKA